jgi:hypothetical protein
MFASRVRNFMRRFRRMEDTVRSLTQHIGDQEALRQASIGGSDLIGPLNSNIDKGKWENITGWSPHPFKRSRGLLSHKGNLYVGLDSVAPGCGELWRMDQYGSWTRVDGPWNSPDEFISIAVFQDQIVVSVSSRTLGPSVWTQQGDIWREMKRWPTELYLSAQCLLAEDDTLWVGMWGKTNSFDIFCCDGKSWRQLPTPVQEKQGVYELRRFNGDLYAGLGGPGTGPASVWRQCRGEWQRIDQKAWTNPSAHTLLALTEFKNKLIVSTHRNPISPGQYSTVWALESDTWHPVGNHRVPRNFGVMYSYNALLSWGDDLLLGAGGAPGTSSIWRLNSNGTWQVAAGFGVNGSWGTGDGTVYLTKQPASHEYVYRMIDHNGSLIVGFGGRAGCAQVWRFSPQR